MINCDFLPKLLTEERLTKFRARGSRIKIIKSINVLGSRHAGIYFVSAACRKNNKVVHVLKVVFDSFAKTLK